MSIQIPRNKWIAVYNSISLCWFVVDCNNNRQEEVAKINSAYNMFCRERGFPGMGFNVTAPENMVLFGYAVIVRVKEIIDPAIKGINVSGVTAKEYLFQSMIDAARSYGSDYFSSYNQFIANQNIDIIECSFSNKAEFEKYYQFMTHIRHSIAHSTYELKDGGNSIYLKSEHDKIVHFEATMPLPAFINFVLNLGICLNRVLHEKHMLTE